jgi:hypothetical protein
VPSGIFGSTAIQSSTSPLVPNPSPTMSFVLFLSRRNMVEPLPNRQPCPSVAECESSPFSPNPRRDSHRVDFGCHQHAFALGPEERLGRLRVSSLPAVAPAHAATLCGHKKLLDLLEGRAGEAPVRRDVVNSGKSKIPTVQPITFEIASTLRVNLASP